MNSLGAGTCQKRCWTVFTRRLPNNAVRATPTNPTISPINTIIISPSKIPSDKITTPADGNVSRPLNGGAIKATIVRKIINKPISVWPAWLVMVLRKRGREKRSNQRIILMTSGRAFFSRGLPILMWRQRLGTQTLLRPAINSSAKRTTIISKTWVTPPVGSGSAAGIISKINKAAKLRSAKTSPKP